MPKFNKYKVRSPYYHWQQISRNILVFNAFVMARYQQVIKLIPNKKNQKILDIGCGDGVLLSLIKKGKLYGVDLDQTSLDYATAKVKAKFIKATATKLPFRNNFFDVVIATEIIEHLSRPKLMLQEIQRVLKSNGKIIISTPIKKRVGLTDKLHVREFSVQELDELLSQYFVKVKIYPSHPEWLKNIYTFNLLSFNRFHFDLFRWLINSVEIITGYNPFSMKLGQPTQQLVVARKK